MAGKGDIVEQALKLVMGGGDDAAQNALRQSAQQATDIPAHLRPGFKVEAAPGADEETRNLVDYLSQRDPNLAFDTQSLAERREDLGTTVPAFHGSPRNIERFTNKYSSPEGYWGGHHYFTTSPVDASVNYATPEGADLFRRLEGSVERTLDNFHPSDVTEWYAGKYGSSKGVNPVDPKIVKEYADDIAKQELGITNEGAVYPVNLRMKNPVKIDSPDQTFWGYDTQYDEAGDIVSEGGPAADLIQATRDVLADYNVSDRGAEELIGKLYESAADYGGIDAKSYNDILRGSHMDLYDEEGNMVSMGHVMADAFRRMGHDSIDMPTDVFAGGLGRVGMAGTGGNTRHYIVFDPQNVRSRFGAFDPFKAASKRISDAEGGAIESNDDIDDALRIAKDVGGSTPVLMEDAKGNKYDAQGNIIPPTNPGPNPARSDVTPQSVAAKAVNDPATYDALMERYAIPDRDIAEYETLKETVGKQPQAVQQMTHVGDRPRREMKIDMPLFGGEYSMGTAPYDVAEGLQGMAQGAYDFKTMPAYLFPPTALFALGADVLESRLADDPLGFALNAALTPQGASAAKSFGRSALDLVRRNPKATAAAVGTGAYLSPDEAEAGPERWFSKAMEVARAIPMEKMTGQQALAMLRKGVSPEELRWTGADVFLSTTPKVSKEELLDYLKNNRFQTEDVTLGGGRPTKREDVKPTPTASAPYMEEWNRLKAEDEKLNADFDLSEADKSVQGMEDFWKRQFEIEEQKDELRSKMIDATIEEMGGLGLPVQYGPGSRFGDLYVTRGGEEYGEDLYRMPNAMKLYNSYVKQLREKYGNGALGDMPLTVSERGTLDNLMEAGGDERKVYTSSHFPQYPGYLAHSRSQTLNVEPPGANRPYKAWNVEEAQSDLAKSGRKSGFHDPVVYQKWVNEYYANERAIEKARDSLKEVADRVGGAIGPEPKSWRDPAWNEYNVRRQETLDASPEVKSAREALDNLVARGAELDAAIPNTMAAPIGPFVKSMEGWSKLTVKKQLDKALDSGADYFTWTPGEAQAQRYSLSRVADNIVYNAPFVAPSGKSYPGRLIATKNGSQVFEKEGVKPEQLSEFIGEELADKIKANKTTVEEGPMKGWEKSSISGDELKFGGEGMRKYYDSAFVKYVQDVFKEATGEKPNIEVITAQTADGPRQQLGVRITDEMREKARFSDFNKGGRVSDPIVNKALSLTRY